VAPTFTQTIWFGALCLAFLGGLVLLAYQLRIRYVTGELRQRMYERLAERERIARDLHDTFFQGIQGLLLRFHTATSQLPKDDPTRRILEETLLQSDQVMLEGRELVLDLRDGFGLERFTGGLRGIRKADAGEPGVQIRRDRQRCRAAAASGCLRGNRENREGSAGQRVSSFRGKID
jgi:hypothetical protein